MYFDIVIACLHFAIGMHYDNQKSQLVFGSKGGVVEAVSVAPTEQVVIGRLTVGTIGCAWGGFLLWKAGKKVISHPHFQVFQRYNNIEIKGSEHLKLRPLSSASWMAYTGDRA